MDALIRYVCIDPAHTRGGHIALGDLTVYSGSWAFCPADARAGHSWKDVGGIGVEGLVRFGLQAPPHAGTVSS